jgi:arsenical pump membrane protein
MVVVVWQPRGLSVGWPAALGGGLAVAAGLVPPAEVVTVVHLVWDATLAFVGIILNSLVLDEVGVFRWAALLLVRRAANGRRLFVEACLLGAAVSAVFANDGAALILTPLVYEQAKALGWPKEASVALVLAGGLIADFTSTPLVTSNLVNILVADDFHLGFAGYALRMVPVDIVTLALSLGGLLVVYRRTLPGPLPRDADDPRSAVRDPWLFRWSLILLALLLVAFFLTEPFHVPVAFVVLAVTALLLGLARKSPAVSVRQVVRDAPWSVVAFSLGMYVVVFALKKAGWLRPLTGLLHAAAHQGSLTAVMAAGGLSAVLSAVVNNLPAVVVVALGIHAAHPGLRLAPLMAYADVVGADLGTKLTPIGSLATLLWLHVLDRRGMRVDWGPFLRLGLLLTFPVLAGALLTLWAWTTVTR